MREAAYHTSAAADLPVEAFNNVVGADAGPVFGRIITIRLGLQRVSLLHSIRALHAMSLFCAAHLTLFKMV